MAIYDSYRAYASKSQFDRDEKTSTCDYLTHAKLGSNRGWIKNVNFFDKARVCVVPVQKNLACFVSMIQKL